MHTEFEVRVLEVDTNEMVKKILRLGGQKVADYNYKRMVYDFNPPQENKWIRLRTDGMKTTLTIKNVLANEIDGTKETEIQVSDFSETDKVLNELGYFSKSYQENRRKRYELNGVEIDFDTWPYIPTYMEVEGKNEEEVYAVLEALDITDDKVTADGVQDIYINHYKIDIKKMKEINFGIPLDKKYKL